MPKAIARSPLPDLPRSTRHQRARQAVDRNTPRAADVYSEFASTISSSPQGTWKRIRGHRASVGAIHKKCPDRRRGGFDRRFRVGLVCSQFIARLQR